MLDPKALEAALSAADRVYLTTTTESTSSHVAVEAGITAYLQAVQPAVTETGCRDKNGTMIRLGDRLLYHNGGNRTKEDYWKPEYEVIWDAPSFELKHVGGGKDAGSHSFILKHGARNGYLEIIKSVDAAKSPLQADLDHCEAATALNTHVAAEPVDWQSIETAQRDRPILAAEWDGEGWAVGICVWCKTPHVPLYGWHFTEGDPEDWDIANPTLWMEKPCPSLPAAPRPGAKP